MRVYHIIYIGSYIQYIYRNPYLNILYIYIMIMNIKI